MFGGTPRKFWKDILETFWRYFLSVLREINENFVKNAGKFRINLKEISKKLWENLDAISR